MRYAALRSEEVNDFKTAISQAFHSLCEFLSSSSINIISYFLEKVKSFSVSLIEEPVVSGDHKKGFSEFLSHFLYILYHIFDKKSNSFSVIFVERIRRAVVFYSD